MRIGIGVTTNNVFETIQRFSSFIKSNMVFHTCDDNETVAKDKNKLIKLLYDEGCDYIILFDDDCFPIKEGWDDFLIEASKHTESEHFVIANDNHHTLVDFENGLNYFRMCAGCMLFMTRRVIDTIGYLNPNYGKYGYEHGAYSIRAHKGGFTPYPFVTVDGWEEYIYSYDLQGQAHGFVKTDWATKKEKLDLLEENKDEYSREVNGLQLYYDFEENKKPKEVKTYIGGIKRVIYFNWFSEGTEFYRMLPLEYIDNSNLQITRSTEKNITFATIFAYDVVIISRPVGISSINLIHLCKDMGKTVIADYDDNCLNLPNDMHPLYETYEREKRSLIECLVLCDEIWVTTQGIKNSYKAYNKNIVVIPNAHNDYLYSIKNKSKWTKNNSALWRGGIYHTGDIYENGTTEWLINAINSNKKWNFYFVGQRFEWLEARIRYPNYHRVDTVTTTQLPKLLANFNASIAYYPLATNIFNKGKSNCFWLENTYAGSAVFGNKKLHEFNKDCILPLAEMPDAMKGDIDLSRYNKESWENICDTLLVSSVNKIREKRLLEI
jgi:hypothetical protein